MRAMFWSMMMALVASNAACLRKTEFHCTTDADCSATGGVCETTTYCSVPDPMCDEGRRYADLSGELSNQCVGGGMIAVDASMPDTPTLIDAPAGSCPAGYITVTGGGTHLYKKTISAG